MNNIYALNKEFKEQQILSHDELNLIVTKINEIIAFIAPLNKDSETDPQDDNQNEGITKSIEELIQEAIAGLVADVDRLKNTPSGQVVTEEMWAQYRNKTDETMQKVSAIELAFDGIDLTSLAANIQAAETLVSQLSISPEKINLIVSLVDDDGNLIIEPANIIAAITKDNGSGELISSIKISADQVTVSGNTTLQGAITRINGKLEGIDAQFENIGVNDTIEGKHIKGGDINIKNNFIVDENGHVTAKSISLNGQGSTFVIQPNAPNNIATLPEAKNGATAWVINLYPTTQPSMIDYADKTEVRTQSYNNFNGSDYSKNSYMKLMVGNRWEYASGQGTRTACSIGAGRFDLVSFALFVSDGKDWYLALENVL